MDHTDWTTTGALGDRYVLRSRVGSGRTTTVYVADDIRLEREVAVKLFLGEPDDTGLTRFAEEARVLAGLSHPGLVTVYDVNINTDRPFIVMRYVDGGPLTELIESGALRPNMVARLGAQLAEVLAYVHERGVVHGDLDGSNVLVDAAGSAHLTGFGVDRGLGRPSGDVHALGMTIAECLPFDLGPEWRAVLDAMTHRDPDARPEAVRCAELLRNIEAGETTTFPLPDVIEAAMAAETGQHEPASTPTARLAPPLAARAARAARAASEPKRVRPAHAGLAGMALGITALAIVVAVATTGTPSQPVGEQGQQPPPAVEEGADDRVVPPARTYPQPGGDLPEPDSPEPDPATSESREASPSAPTSTSPNDEDGFDDDFDRDRDGDRDDFDDDDGFDDDGDGRDDDGDDGDRDDDRDDDGRDDDHDGRDDDGDGRDKDGGFGDGKGKGKGRGNGHGEPQGLIGSVLAVLLG